MTDHDDGDGGGVRHLFTAAEAETVFGIPAATIRAWASRHRIYPYGIDHHGHPMYDRTDLVALRHRIRRS